MRFGCCASLDAIQTVQDAGYDYVEMRVGAVKPEAPDSEFEPIRDLIHSYEIVPEAWNCLLNGDMKVVGPEVDTYRLERYLRTAFERIGELGGEIVSFGSGTARTIPEDFPKDEARAQIIEFVTLAGQVAGAHGITVAVEPLDANSTNFVNAVTEAVQLVREVDHPFVKVLADLHHMMQGNELVNAVIEAGNELVHTHTADTGRLYPGTGSYPHREFFEALRSIGYNDRMSIECSWEHSIEDCTKALGFLRGLDADVPF